MKKAFTMLELIIVIIVMGILAAVALPRFSDTRVQEAADQILSHIRYTQHLALIDNPYSPTNSNWYKERWQIGFWQCTNNDWYYIVGHDLDHGGGIGESEAATNPFDGKKMFTSNACNLDNNQSSAILISEKYGISSISFSSACGDNKYIAFDHLGRPYKSTLGTEMYDLIQQTCDINFTADSGSFTIRIEPETGFAYIANLNY